MICLWLSSAMLLLLFTESMQRNPTAVLCWSRVKARSAWARGDATTTTTRFWARWHRRGACKTHAWSCLSCERKTRAKEGWGRLAHCLMHSTDLVSSVRVATSCVTHPLLFCVGLQMGSPPLSALYENCPLSQRHIPPSAGEGGEIMLLLLEKMRERALWMFVFTEAGNISKWI